MEMLHEEGDKEAIEGIRAGWMNGWVDGLMKRK